MTTRYITANQGFLSTDSGDDTYVAQGITISGGIDMRGNGGGNQSLTLYGTVFGNIDDYFSATSGNDNIFIASTGGVSTYSWGAIKLGGGGHVIVNHGTISSADGYALYIAGNVGLDGALQTRITNTGTMTSFTDVGTNYTIQANNPGGIAVANSGDITSANGYALGLGTGNNVVTNSGFIGGQTEFGSGNDFFDFRQGTMNGIVLGGSGNDTIYGSIDDNTLYGSNGTDLIDGHLGADLMIGGADNDVYVVDNAGDVVDEGIANNGNGSDTIRSSINFDLSNTAQVVGIVEKLVLTGASALDATGSARSETIEGNVAANVIRGDGGNDRLYGFAGDDKLVGADGEDRLYGAAGDDRLHGGLGDDILSGGADADVMFGGADNDTYVFSNFEQLADESVNGSSGIDLVQSSVSFRLSDTTRVLGTVENLTLTGSADASALGSTGENTIVGNAGANTIDGNLGDDILTGGADIDKFRFSTSLSGNVDTITDFVHDTDQILLSDAIFSKLSAGNLAAGNFAINAASDANDYIVYNTTTGVLRYDADGNGAGVAVAFAKLDGVPGLTQSDFLIY